MVGRRRRLDTKLIALGRNIVACDFIVLVAVNGVSGMWFDQLAMYSPSVLGYRGHSIHMV